MLSTATLSPQYPQLVPQYPQLVPSQSISDAAYTHTPTQKDIGVSGSVAHGVKPDPVP